MPTNFSKLGYNHVTFGWPSSCECNCSISLHFFIICSIICQAFTGIMTQIQSIVPYMLRLRITIDMAPTMQLSCLVDVHHEVRYFDICISLCTQCITNII